MYGEVQRLYEEELEGFEMKPPVVEKLAAFQDWAGFEEEAGKHISQAVLEVESKIF